MPRSALVIIDLQNEFLSEKGNFYVLDSAKSTMLQNLANLIPRFRGFGQVVWVQSFYTIGPTPNTHLDRLAGTHHGRTPCCEEGTWNAELHSSALALREKTDSTVVKRNYSAFKDTSLKQVLTAGRTTDVFFCGLLSNTCVLATITEAVQFQDVDWRVFAIPDCLAYRNEQSHAKALVRMADMLVQLVTTEQLSDGLIPPQIPTSLETPVLYYVNGSIPSWRVQISLNEKRITVDQKRMKVMTTPKPTRLPAFLALNHRGKTPVFIDNDPARTTVNESIAILLYLETYYPQTPLLPPSERRTERARVLSLVQETENLHSAYDALDVAFFAAQEQGTLATFKEEIRPVLLESLYKELNFWEIYASQSISYIAGGRDFTLADCAFYPLLGFMLRRGFEFGDRWKGLERYHKVVWSRTGVQSAQPEGWVGAGNVNVFD